METGLSDKWGVLGALHLDLICSLPEEFLRNTSDSQTWLNWEIAPGGVGMNMARHIEEAGQQSVLFALAGSGALSEYAKSLATGKLSNCKTVSLPGPQEVGLVCLIYVETDKARHRLVIGPQLAQVDVVRYADVREHMRPFASHLKGLFLDGYLLKGRVDEWLSDITAMVSDQWKLHLQLVPHDIWTELSERNLRRLRGLCASISSDLSTVERIVGLNPAITLAIMERAINIARLLGRVRGPDTELRLRWGYEKQSEFCLVFKNDGSGVVWQYSPAARAVPRSAQDRLYVREISETVPDHWRTEVGRFVIGK
jgi:hypothetical protein